MNVWWGQDHGQRRGELGRPRRRRRGATSTCFGRGYGDAAARPHLFKAGADLLDNREHHVPGALGLVYAFASVMTCSAGRTAVPQAFGAEAFFQSNPTRGLFAQDSGGRARRLRSRRACATTCSGCPRSGSASTPTTSAADRSPGRGQSPDGDPGERRPARPDPAARRRTRAAARRHQLQSGGAAVTRAVGAGISRRHHVVSGRRADRHHQHRSGGQNGPEQFGLQIERGVGRSRRDLRLFVCAAAASSCRATSTCRALTPRRRRLLRARPRAATRTSATSASTRRSAIRGSTG